MGLSTDGQICYGILFEEGTEFPWDDERFDDTIHDWWKEVKGYEPLHQPWTPEGNYAEGWEKNDPRFEECYAHRRAWEEKNPLPVDLVNCCSDECPIWILAVPSTVKKARRGYPASFDPKDLKVTHDEERLLLQFCHEYCPENDERLCWRLSSYWG